MAVTLQPHPRKCISLQEKLAVESNYNRNECQEKHGQIVPKFREMPPLLAFPKNHPIQLPTSCRGLLNHYLGKYKHFTVTMEKNLRQA